MPGIFKASLRVFVILGCAILIALGIMTAYGVYVLRVKDGGGQPLDFVLIAGGLAVALGGGLCFHLLLRPKKQEVQIEDEGW